MPTTKRCTLDAPLVRPFTLDDLPGLMGDDGQKIGIDGTARAVEKRGNSGKSELGTTLPIECIRDSPTLTTLKRKLEEPEHNRLLYICNLCSSVGHHEILEHFVSFGTVERVEVHSFSDNLYYATILYARIESIEMAMRANPHKFHNRQYYCRKKREHGESPKWISGLESERESEDDKKRSSRTPTKSQRCCDPDSKFDLRSYFYAASGRSQSKLWTTSPAKEETTNPSLVLPKVVQVLRDLRHREYPQLAEKLESTRCVRARSAASPTPEETPPRAIALVCQGITKLDKPDPRCALAWSRMFGSYQFVRHNYVDPTIVYGQEVPIEHQIELTADKYAAITYLGREFECN